MTTDTRKATNKGGMQTRKHNKSKPDDLLRIVRDLSEYNFRDE